MKNNLSGAAIANRKQPCMMFETRILLAQASGGVRVSTWQQEEYRKRRDAVLIRAACVGSYVSEFRQPPQGLK